MVFFKRTLPIIIAIAFGLVTLFGLLIVPDVGRLLLGWASFLAAFALVMGALNLLAVHISRIRNSFHSVVLVVSMVAVLAFGVTDTLGLTEGWLELAFNQLQAPLEAALAATVAFFLLFAGMRLWQRSRTIWSTLFLFTALLVLVSQSPLPEAVRTLVDPLYQTLSDVFVSAGVRGLLIGVALGTITLSIRLLAGLERPYSE